MADHSLRSIEHIKKGDSVLSRDATSSRLVPELILKNHASHVSATVTLHLSNGKALVMSGHQPLVMHGGAVARAEDIARRIGTSIPIGGKSPQTGGGEGTRRTVSWQKIPQPVRLRTSKGTEVHVVSSHVTEGERTVYWLETRHKRNIFLRDIEISTDPDEKDDNPLPIESEV